MTQFIIGLTVGVPVGFVACSLLCIEKRTDRRNHPERRKWAPSHFIECWSDGMWISQDRRRTPDRRLDSILVRES